MKEKCCYTYGKNRGRNVVIEESAIPLLDDYKCGVLYRAIMDVQAGSTIIFRNIAGCLFYSYSEGIWLSL